MIKYRLEITKGEPIRYISHLDFASLMQRAICRAHLPAVSLFPYGEVRQA